jgi:hypothetical protein
MSGGGRAPWWYSGGEEPGAPDGGPSAASSSDTGPAGGGVDWTALLAGAQRVVDWATDRVMAPHAEHEDPAAHPDCVVCRTIVLVSDSGSGPAEPATPSATAPSITWIPVRDDPSAAGTGQ